MRALISSFLCALIAATTLHGQDNPMSQEPTSQQAQGVEYITLSNGYRVWTKRVGHGPVKILTLHGGPGCTHEYFECFEEFFPKDRYQIIFYDQLGSHYSDQPTDKTLWTVDRFREEVEEVRKALNLTDFYLYGQSWGALLSIEYALKYQEHLKGVILSNITGSVKSYVDYLNELRRKLPQATQDALAFYEDKEDFFNPEYEKIMLEEIYALHLCRLKPWPESLVRTFEHLNKQVYQTVQGPNEFVVTGNFKDWNRWNDLANITIPTLLICGKYDTMSPQDNEKMGTLIPHSRVKICENGSHCCLFDDQENYFQALLGFLDDVEEGVFFKTAPLEVTKEKILRNLSKGLKSPSMAHPVLILLGGYVGAGKTTLATALKKEYNLTLFSLNAIRQAMLDEGIDIRQNKQEERAILIDIYPKLFSPCLEHSSHIVIDANANAQGIQEAMRFLKEHQLEMHYRVVKIHLHASQEELFKRVRARAQLAHLHQGTAQDLEYELKTPSKALHPEDYDLSIDTEKTPFEEEFKKVQALLNPFFE